MNIVQAIHDSQLFAPLFRESSTWSAWEVYLKALFGLGIKDKAGLQIFRKSTGLERPPAAPAKESYIIAGRRSGKSFMSAIIAVFLACFKDWRPCLSPGETGHVFIIATDRAQARIVKNYVSGILSSGPILRAMVVNDLKESIELKNAIEITIKTASYRTLRGFTVLAAILEELAFWRSTEESANPDKEILAALRPALATVPESLIIGISSPYSRQGVLYEQFKRHFGKDEGSLIWKAETRLMNPTIDARTIEEAMREDPAAARAEWLAEFREDISSFLPVELVETVTIRGRHELPRAEGVNYMGFIDPAGGSGSDSFALAIAHRTREGKIILDAVRERRPPFSPEEVVSEFAEVLRLYQVREIGSDCYAGEWPREAFRREDITVRTSDLSTSELYLEFLPLVTGARVELLDNKRLFSQLVNLERRTRTGGKDLVTHFVNEHDDLANVCAGAMVLAAKRPRRIGRVCY